MTLTRGAFIMSAIGGVLSFCALMIPAFEASRSPIARDRQEASRPSQLSFFQRYYLDVLLLVVSLVLFRQLTEQGSLAATNLLGEVAVNQLLLAVPAITLVASAMVLLRIFPVVMGLASRLLARRLPPGLVMGLWQMASESHALRAAGAAADFDGGIGHIRRQLRRHSPTQLYGEGSVLGGRGHTAYQRIHQHARRFAPDG